MPEEVEECVSSILEDNPDMDESSAYAICQSEQKAEEEGIRDALAVKAVAAKKETGSWQGIHPSEKTMKGRERLLELFSDTVQKTTTETASTKFKAKVKSESGMRVLYKADDGSMLIWGPGSVEVVDKENDRVTTEALKDALPQLMRRQRLSLDHTDQLVGDIKEKHEFEEPKTVEIHGKEYKRQTFPTDVLKADEDDVPEDGLYVAGEVWSDTKQAKEAQEEIENGVIDSFSISGEAISSSTKIKDGEHFDDIKEMDLSAVTLCEEGMNQKAKFAVVKSDEKKSKFKEIVSDVLSTTMSKEDDDESEGGVGGDDSMDNISESFSEEEEKKLKTMFESVVKEHLPDGELATKDDIPKMPEDKPEDDPEDKPEDDPEDIPKMPEDKPEDDPEGEDLDEVDADDIKDPDKDEEAERDIVGGEEEEKATGAGASDILEAARTLSEATDKSVEDILSGSDSKMPEEDEDEMEDEEHKVEDDDEIADSHDIPIDKLKANLPDDLYRAVTDHLSDPAEKAQEGAEAEESEEDDPNHSRAEKARETPNTGSMEKGKADGSSGGSFDGYLRERVSGGSVGSFDADKDLQKSFDGEDEKVETDGTHADQLQKEVMDI
ncbi:MAG: hypothetical protein ABEK59_11800 [Halobacteria archaeon]